MEDLVCALLECGIRDLDKLDEILVKAKNWKVEIDLNEIVERAREEFNKTDFNTILNLIMNEIFEDLISEFSEEEKEILRDNFNPFLNYLDSWFNNGLDELNEDSSREEAIRVLREWLKELKNSRREEAIKVLGEWLKELKKEEN